MGASEQQGQSLLPGSTTTSPSGVDTAELPGVLLAAEAMLSVRAGVEMPSSTWSFLMACSTAVCHLSASSCSGKAKESFSPLPNSTRMPHMRASS